MIKLGENFPSFLIYLEDTDNPSEIGGSPCLLNYVCRSKALCIKIQLKHRRLHYVKD